MSKFAELAEKIERDATLPEEHRLQAAAALRNVAAEELLEKARPALTAGSLALLEEASAYLMMADRLHDRSRRWEGAILLALCDLIREVKRKG